MQLNNILTGWANLVKNKFGLLDENTKRIASIRLVHCNVCPVRKNNVCDPNSQIKNQITGEFVKGCGCNIAAKALSPASQCPAAKW